jgi:AcrR family transcriptional regulator
VDRHSIRKCPFPKQPKLLGRAANTAELATKGERTRAALLEAGYRLFVTQGYHATSTRDIASAAGLAVGGIYNYFQSKEDIYLELLTQRHALVDILPALQQAQGDTVEELVRDAATQMITVLRNNHQGLALTFVELAEFKGKHLPQLFKVAYPSFQDFARRLTEAHGTLRDVPMPLMLRVFLGMFFSYFITDLVAGKQLPAKVTQDAFDSFVDIYLHGIVTEG